MNPFQFNPIMFQAFPFIPFNCLPFNGNYQIFPEYYNEEQEAVNKNLMKSSVQQSSQTFGRKMNNNYEHKDINLNEKRKLNSKIKFENYNAPSNGKCKDNLGDILNFKIGSKEHSSNKSKYICNKFDDFSMIEKDKNIKNEITLKIKFKNMIINQNKYRYLNLLEFIFLETIFKK